MENPENKTTPEAPAMEAAPLLPPPAPEAAPAPNILTRIARAIDRAFEAEPKRTGLGLTCYILLDTSGGQGLIVAPSQLEKLRNWQSQHDAAMEILTTHSPDLAYEHWQTHEAELLKGVQDKNLHEIASKSREDFERDLDRKGNAARRELSRIYNECFPLCSGIAERFVDLATKKLKQEEQRDREHHEFYGITYSTPSEIILNFRNAIRFAKQRAQKNEEFGQASPREIIPYINF